MHRSAGRALAALAIAAGLAGSAVTLAHPATGSAVTLAHPAAGSARAPASPAPARHVVLIGIGGLGWRDVTPSGTPALWRLAQHGAVGSLAVSGVRPRTCPADGWLTLNGAARAAVPGSAAGPCPAPRVVAGIAAPAGQPSPAGRTSGNRGPGAPGPALVPAMPALVRQDTAYAPDWGLLASAPGRGGCATAVGPGAALALASRTGQVDSYLPTASGLTAADLARCPLTVIDLGSLPPRTSSAPASAAWHARSAALRDADRELGSLSAGLAGNSALVLISPGGPTPQLRVLIASAPGLRTGLLTTASTREPGLVALTDLTPAILRWFGTPPPSAVVGAPLQVQARSGLAATVAALRARDVAAQVYRSTITPFFVLVGVGYAAMFALIWAAPFGRGEQRWRRRRAIARAAGIWAAALPAATFLASLVPWWTFSHPAAVLYCLALVWAAAIAALALAGPWRRDPLGAAGVVAAVTLAVIGLDLMTGSRLQRETPFGLSALVAGRFYGLGNNAVVIFAASGIVCAAWTGSALLRHGPRSRALAVMGAIAAVTVVVSGWPGFGAKVGGTIAMAPAFLLLLAAAARVRVTPRRALLAAASGLAVVAVFALVTYLVPIAGQSHLSGFVGRALHGGAGAILARKLGANLGSLTSNPLVPAIPVVVVALGAVIAWPDRVRASLLTRAYREVPLLRATLSAVWLAAVLGWFAEDSGATVPAAALPMVLPLAVAILSSLPERARAPAGPSLPAQTGPTGRDRATSGPGGYL